MTFALERGEGSASRPGSTLPPVKDPVPIVQEAGWASGSVWTGAENLAPTEIRSQDRPVRRQSLYRLSYPAHSFDISSDELLGSVVRDVVIPLSVEWSGFFQGRGLL